MLLFMKNKAAVIKEKEASWNSKTGGKGENISAVNRWRGGDNQMKMGTAELAQ